MKVYLVKQRLPVTRWDNPSPTVAIRDSRKDALKVAAELEAKIAGSSFEVEETGGN